MPNYQNGKIYKITSSQTDLIYIGSTVEKLNLRFAHHKHQFKKNINGTKSKEILKYDDAKIELIESYPCNSKEDLFKREREYIKSLNCVNNHSSSTVVKEMEEYKYMCEWCNYKCCKKCDYTKHLNTEKHKNKIISNKENGTYLSTISTTVDPSSNEIKVMTSLMVELVKGNNDLQKQVLEICQKMQQPSITTNSHNNTTNSHNKTFNLHFFLNEECKDAMNMSEFIDSIKVKISDLENIGKLGYIEGMSNIIIKQLNDTDVNKRPIHCSDAKRETLYVKEENKWEKDTEENRKMAKAVRDVDKKNYQLLSNWKEIYPECANSKSKQSDEYLKVVNKVMDGDEENVNKVIKKVSKQVLIDK